MEELQPLGSIECQSPEPDPARYVILSGLELGKAKKIRCPHMDSTVINSCYHSPDLNNEKPLK